MFLDTQTKFSDAQPVTVTAVSSNVLDLRNAATPTLVDEGILNQMWLVAQVNAAFTAAGAATCTITLESSSTADLATSPTVHYSSGAIAVASMTLNTVLARFPIPSGDYQRYVGLRYTIATGPMTAGTITGFVTPDVQRNVIYPTGFSVK